MPPVLLCSATIADPTVNVTMPVLGIVEHIAMGREIHPVMIDRFQHGRSIDELEVVHEVIFLMWLYLQTEKAKVGCVRPHPEMKRRETVFQVFNNADTRNPVYLNSLHQNGSG
ncbi:MAG: hypothetical protein M3R24_39785 [Chloroflexota bacterium]|nr:hypothetical protein [Chloroflexota bacterium]